MALSLSFLRKTTPAEREAVKRGELVVDVDAIASMVRARIEGDATKAGPPIMDPEERRALGSELKTRYSALLAAREEYAARVASAEVRRDAAIRECELLYGSAPDETQFTAFREQAWARLLAEQPPLVGALVARVHREADALRHEAFVVPADRSQDRAPAQYGVGAMVADGAAPADRERRAVTNEASVRVRVAALRDLANQILRWTRDGDFADDAELTALFKSAHAALPQVEPIESVMRRDPRARQFVRESGPSLPPAA